MSIGRDNASKGFLGLLCTPLDSSVLLWTPLGSSGLSRSKVVQLAETGITYIKHTLKV